MARVTGIQRRAAFARQQHETYSNYDMSCVTNEVQVSRTGSHVQVFFPQQGNDARGVGLGLSEEAAKTLAGLLSAAVSGGTERGSATLGYGD